MANVKDVYASNSEFLKADDLEGDEIVLTISGAKVEAFKNDQGQDVSKVVLSFKEIDKTLVCNKTNGNSIAYAYGDETNDWVGKPITLFTQMVEYNKRMVPAIRVRATKPKAGTPSKLLKQAGADAQAPFDDEIPF